MSSNYIEYNRMSTASNANDLFFPRSFIGKNLNELGINFIRVCNVNEINSAINHQRLYGLESLELLNNARDVYYFDEDQSLQHAKILSSYAISVKIKDNEKVYIDIFKFGGNNLKDYFTKQNCLRLVSNKSHILEKIAPIYIN